MSLTEKQLNEIREELIHCKKPLFFFHDDADGLSSFLLLYRFKGEGKGVVVKSVPKLDEKFVRKVEEYLPDKVFILDIAVVEQDFIDKVAVPIIWIDHHEPLKREKIKYFNPRIEKKTDNLPVTYLCYQITQQNMWIAAVGCIGDWFYPEFMNEFKEKYPDLLETNSKEPGTVLFTTKLGKLATIFNFIMKGKTQDANKCIRIMTRIKTPYEILNEETPKGKYILRRYEKINALYGELLNKALKERVTEKTVIFSYKENKMSFTGEISNELLFRSPNKIIIIAREKKGEMRMSLRAQHKQILPMLKKALIGLDGYGGGHEYACGACVKKKDFKEFLKRIEEQI